jgi:hypothetical protein
MQIQPTNPYNPPGGPDGTPGLPKAEPVGADSQRIRRTPPAAQSEVEALARQAAETEEINQAAVAEAKKLLQSGELSSPEAIRRAAENLLNRGI